MNYSFRFSNETNKNRLGRARNSFGLARPPSSLFLKASENKIKVKITMVDFQQQSPQRLIIRYEHMNSQNDRLDLRLNPLQREYYFIKYGKSYVINCNYACFHSLRLFTL